MDGRLAGNAFCCRYEADENMVCWITQLVVHCDYRERGLASGLLNELKTDRDDIFALMSSHPAACLAAAKTYGGMCLLGHSTNLALIRCRWNQHDTAGLHKIARRISLESVTNKLCKRR